MKPGFQCGLAPWNPGFMLFVLSRTEAKSPRTAAASRATSAARTNRVQAVGYAYRHGLVHR